MFLNTFLPNKEPRPHGEMPDSRVRAGKLEDEFGTDSNPESQVFKGIEDSSKDRGTNLMGFH